MHRVVLKSFDVLAVVGGGACYVQLLRYLLTLLHPMLDEPALPLEKMAFTGATALISCGAIYLLNAYVVRQNNLALGVACSAWAYLYFYIVKLWPHPGQIISVLMTGYSAFAFVMFIVFPVAVGIYLNKIRPAGGITQLLATLK